MTTTRKESVRKDRKDRKSHDDVATPGETCDMPGDTSKEGEKKPECPDGYPTEQPTGKPSDQAKK